LTNFQLKFTVIAFGTLSRNFNTLRVYVADQQTPVPHWVEDPTAETTADVWVKIPNLVNGMILTLTDGSPNSSNPEDVFELFDNFDGTALNSSKWVPLPNTPHITTLPKMERRQSEVIMQ
jgi:hypothetical protein